LRLCAEARRKLPHLPRMTAQDQMLQKSSRASTPRAMGPLLWRLSTRALAPDVGSGAGVPVSAWKRKSAKRRCVIAAVFTVTESRLRAQGLWLCPAGVKVKSLDY